MFPVHRERHSSVALTKKTGATHTPICLIIAIVSMLVVVDVNAEERDIFELSLRELLDLKITGSTLTESDLKHTPSAVTLFTRDQIRRLPVDTVEELLNLVPGYQRFRQGGDSLLYTYSARGRRINAGVGEILTLVDGLQLASPRTGNNAAPLFGVAIGNVERVEFIRGPGSALYGSNAMMGVINIITRRFYNEAKITGGSFDRRAAELSLASNWDELTLDLHARMDIDNGDHYTVADSFSRAPIATRDPREVMDLYLQWQWRDTKFLMRRGTRATEEFYVLDLLKNEVNYNRNWRNQFALSDEFAGIGGHSKLMLSYTSDQLDLAAELLPPGALAAISSPASTDALRLRGIFESEKWQLNWHQDWPLATGSLQAGLDLRRIETTKAIGYNNFDLADLSMRQFPIRYYGELLPTTTLENLVSRDNIGLYLQYLRSLGEHTDLTLGVRYDDYRDVGQQTSPRLGLVHQLNDLHSVKLLYGEAFRAPSIAETDLINNPVIVGNPELQAESVKTWDLIWMANFNELAISLGYFDNRFEHSIVVAATGRQLFYANADQGPSRGFELEAHYQLTPDWLLRASAMTLTKKPVESFREADQMFSLAALWRSGNWRAGITAVYAGARQMGVNGSADNKLALPAYNLLDAKLNYALSEQWEMLFQLKNALDEDYETPPQSVSYIHGVPNRGREWALSVQWQF